MIQFNEIKPSPLKSLCTGIENLDQFISADGGVPLGNIFLMSGVAGCGKTSLSLLILSRIKTHQTALLEREVSAEFLAKQFKNVNASINSNFYIDDRMSIQEFLEYTAKNNIKIIVLDSLPRLREDFPKLGEKAADKAIYRLLRTWATNNHSTCIIIAQSNKDGTYAGSSALKFDSDAHFELLFNQKENTPYIISTKNRMGGPTGTPLYYRFKNTEEILEFSFENFDSETKSLNDKIATTIKNHLDCFKKSDKTLFNECCKAVERIGNLDIDDEEMIRLAIRAVNDIVARKGKLKKVA